MIAGIKGKVIQKIIKSKDFLVIVEIASGIDYEIIVSSFLFSEISENNDIKLVTYFHVREDAQILFGFNNNTEKEIFIKLINVSGIGPKTAINILSVLTVEDLVKVINEGDVTKLCTVPGLGKKSAQKIIIEFQGKIDLLLNDSNVIAIPIIKDLEQALKGLGYKGTEYTQYLNLGKKIYESDKNIVLEKLIIEVLKGDKN